MSASTPLYTEQIIAFKSDGVWLRGCLFSPLKYTGPARLIIMTHGFTALVAHGLVDCARIFLQAGFCVLVYDHRNFGESDGNWPGHVCPIQQIRDLQNALSYVQTLHQIDADRIGVWGTSYSGGHALVLRAIERRVACVVAQTPFIDGYQNVVQHVGERKIARILSKFEQDRALRLAGQPGQYVPVVANDDSQLAVLPGQAAYTFFMACPQWRNAVTLYALELSMNYAPCQFLSRASDTPVLMIIVDDDAINLTSLQQQCYEKIPGTKHLERLKGHHFSPYAEQFSQCVGLARDWFVKHL